VSDTTKPTKQTTKHGTKTATHVSDETITAAQTKKEVQNVSSIVSTADSMHASNNVDAVDMIQKQKKQQ